MSTLKSDLKSLVFLSSLLSFPNLTRNTNTEDMAPKDTASHAEIWDDSALVDSWNDALEEYKVRFEARLHKSRNELTTSRSTIASWREEKMSTKS
jgi:hypothetical protein